MSASQMMEAPVHRNPTHTEVAASAKQAPRSPSIRMELLARIRDLETRGATLDELMAWHAAKNHYGEFGSSGTISGRVTELRRGGFIEAVPLQNGDVLTRPNRRGNQSVVYVATEKEGDGRVCERLRD
jgi:hypothetical protein